MSENNTLNPGVEDSLKAMASENSAPSPSEALQEMHTQLERQDTRTILDAPAAPLVVTRKDTIRVMEEITREMGRFFKSLQEVDNRFADFASEFYKTANKLAEKKRTTKEEDTELLINLAIGGMAQTVGKIWNTITTSKQLSRIKDILQKEAAARLDKVKDMQSYTEMALQPAYDRYSEETSYGQSLVCLSNIRDLEYNAHAARFLVATYESAMRREFQDAVLFPSLSDINRHILYSLLGHQSDFLGGNLIEAHRKQIRSLLSAAKRDITANRQPNREVYVFVADPQIMATAIYDYYPQTLDSMEVEWENEEESILKSESYYRDFISLFDEARSNPAHRLSKAALNNTALADLCSQYPDFEATRDQADSHWGIMMIIVILGCVLGFLASWVHFDLAWYWCLGLGILLGLIVWWLLPTSSLLDKTDEKLTKIEKSIQANSLRNAGEVKIVNLSEIENDNNSRWTFMIIGALVGICFGGFGAIPGAIIGFWLGGYSPDKEEDYSYQHIKVAPSLGSWFLLTALAAGNLYYLYLLIFN